MNGLLSGLVEYWQPDVALGSLKGMVAGIDYSTAIGCSVVTKANFPSGKSLFIPSGSGNPLISTGPNSLLNGYGTVDFLVGLYLQLTGDGSGANISPFLLSDSNFDGYDWRIEDDSFPTPQYSLQGEVPGNDGNYNSFINAYPVVFDPSQLSCVLFWWTVVDSVLHMQADGGVEYTTTIFPVGAGNPSGTTNNCEMRFNASSDIYGGTSFLYKGNSGVTNALSQRALLFGGLPFSQWDSGGVAIPQRAASGQYAIRTH